MELKLKDKLVLPGQCNINSIILRSYNGFEIDVRNHLAELVLHESMDTPCISGYIQLLDNLNLIRNIPLIGNETIEINFSTPSRKDPINQTFFCYKIDTRIESESNKGLAAYKLHFTSLEYLNSLKKKISLSFNNKKYSEMVELIYLQYCFSSKRLLTQETFDKKNLVIPFMTPFDAINMICKKSLSNDLRDRSYIFYEDFDNFCFCNINYFAAGTTPNVRYTWYRHGMSSSTDPNAFKDISKDFYRIESYDVLTANNTINNIKNGLFGSYMLIHDSTYKTVTTDSF
jgi:hypothetical protein